jgi:hypothetical protein
MACLAHLSSRAKIHVALLSLASLFALFCATPSAASNKKNLPTVRWTAGNPCCTFARTDDGHYVWTMIGSDLTVKVFLDSQELAKSRQRFYGLLGAFVSVTYTGQGKFEFPADVRIVFVRHHNVAEPYEDPTELSNNLQNDIDSKVFHTERKIKKAPETNEEKTTLLREYEKDAAEFIEFLSTHGLDPNTVFLTPGNPEAHGWVFFSTSNKWIGPWKKHEDFMISLWMKDKVWQFPVSLPPQQGDATLRKSDD